MDFLKIDSLKEGTERQKLAYITLAKYQVMEKLAAYQPILTGTIPIDIAIQSSDLDIICHWENREKFIEKINFFFGKRREFVIRETLIDGHQTVVANFKLDDFEIEIFGQNIPTQKQNAYLHLLVEHQILLEKGSEFRLKIIQL